MRIRKAIITAPANRSAPCHCSDWLTATELPRPPSKSFSKRPPVPAARRLVLSFSPVTRTPFALPPAVSPPSSNSSPSPNRGAMATRCTARAPFPGRSCIWSATISTSAPTRTGAPSNLSPPPRRKPAPCRPSSRRARRCCPTTARLRGRRVAQRQNLYEIDTVAEKPTPTEAEQKLIIPGLCAGHYLCFFGMHVLTPALMEILAAEVAGPLPRPFNFHPHWPNSPNANATWP